MSLDFDGTDDRADWIINNNLAGHAFTCSFWSYQDSSSVPFTNQYVLCIHDSGNTSYGLIINLTNNTNKGQITCIRHGTTDYIWFEQAAGFVGATVGTWHHFLISSNGGLITGSVALYLDGNPLLVSFTNGSGAETSHVGSWSLGGRIYSDTRNFNGRIDDLGVWDRQLDVSERSLLFSGRMPRSIPSGLVFDANLDKGSLVDSVTSITGTADGATAFLDKILYVPTTETGFGTDAISISTLEEILKSIVDTGTGLDRLSQLLASLTVRDIGTGLDVASLLQAALKFISDVGLSSDAITIQASLTTRDVGTGTDYDDILLILTISENSTGQELLSLSASLSRSDIGTGIDSPSTAAALGLSDGALGGDFLDLSASLSLTEQGAGNDIHKEMPTSLILHFEPKNDGTPELNDITHNISPSTFTGFATGTTGVFGSRGTYFGVAVQDTKYQFLNSVLNPSKGTVAFWINWTGITQATNRVFFDAGGFTSDGFAIVKIPSSSPTVMGIRINNVEVGQGTTIIASGTWYHIINTYDYDANQYKLYVNNVMEISITGSYVTPTYPAEVCIANRISSARSAESFMDEFVILDHVATEQERNDIFNGTYLSALTLSADMDMLEQGRGADTLAQLAANLSLPDTGSSNDLLQLLASLSVNETGSGSDEISILAAALKIISDSGLGSDQVSISVNLSVQDIGTGVEGLSIQVSLTVFDTGTGLDAETVTKIAIILKSLSDLASGSDNISISASLNVGENVIGIDDPAILASLSLEDLADGFESPVISANLTLTDVGSATDLLNILQALIKSIGDIGTGSDAISQITASIPVSETGLGTDQLSQLLASLLVTDFGEGVDVVVAYDSSTQIIKITFSLSQRKMTFSFVPRHMEFSLSNRSTTFTINP